jgi:aminoglycoside phosphotransferase (APT) family kinase protein
MIGERRHISGHQLLGVVRAAFGKRWLESVRRLAGGTSKGVYRLTLDDGRTAIAYVWHADENFWPEPDTGMFGAQGLDAFAAAHTALCGVGVRVPEVVMLDRSGTFVEGEVAVVEDVRCGSLATVEPARAEPVLRRLGQTIRQLHGCGADRYGPPGAALPAGARPVENIVLDRALADLATAAGQVDRIATVRDRLSEALLTRHAAVAPRTRYGLIHGELGPDHVLVDDHDDPVLIDIEGTMSFDVEWEHAYLELRFGDRYRYLAAEGLDGDRLRFYRLATYLSLVAGPLRLLAGDFPDRDAMNAIVSANIERTLGQLSGMDFAD